MPATVVLTSVADGRSARRLSRLLVTRRLAACVSAVDGVRSVYHWKGRIESGRETLLWIKTTRKHLKALEDFFKKHHPYNLPEFLVFSAVGSKKYLSWLEGRH